MKLRAHFVSAVEVDQKLLQQVSDLTERNDHNAARVLVAEKVIKNKKLADAYKGVEMIAAFMGHMDRRLIDLRYEVLDQQLKKHLEAKGLEAFWGKL